MHYDVHVKVIRFAKITEAVFLEDENHIKRSLGSDFCRIDQENRMTQKLTRTCSTNSQVIQGLISVGYLSLVCIS